MHMCHPKFPTALSRRQCTTSSVLTAGQGFSEINCWEPYLLPERPNGVNYLVFLQHVLPDLMQEYQPLCTRKCGSCMIVHQNILQLRCVTTTMRHIPEVNLTRGTCCLVSTLAGAQSLELLLLVCFSDACGYTGETHSIYRRRFRRHRQQIGYV